MSEPMPLSGVREAAPPDSTSELTLGDPLTASPS